jgi:ketosteroid isomerase-like protein
VADHPSLIGTGIDELRFGADAVRLQIARDRSEPDTLSLAVDSLHVDVQHDSAFAFADAVIHAAVDESTLRFPVRSTFGLVRTETGWRIAHFTPRSSTASNLKAGRSR